MPDLLTAIYSLHCLQGLWLALRFIDLFFSTLFRQRLRDFSAPKLGARQNFPSSSPTARGFMNRSDIGLTTDALFAVGEPINVGARRRAAFSEIIVMTFPSPERSG
jgi:hypothetical protein